MCLYFGKKSPQLYYTGKAGKLQFEYQALFFSLNIKNL